MKLFVLVRRDLEWNQRAVQAVHAACLLMRKHGGDP